METVNNKEEILFKALCLFSKKGYDGVGMAEICEEAKVSKPTVYYYFQSKQGLLEAILKDYGTLMSEKLKSAAQNERDFIKNLTCVLKAQIDFAKENPEFFRLYLGLDCNTYDNDVDVTQSLKNLQTSIESVYKELFYKSTETFGNMRGSEELYGNIFKSIVETSTKQIINGHLEPTEENIYKIIKTFVYGCAN